MNKEFTVTISVDLELDAGEEWAEWQVENEVYEMFRVNPYLSAASVRVKEDPA